jgi:hypothetical protein
MDAITIVLESQPQRTVGTTASPPAAASIDATLLAVRQLLNYPPPFGASPSAVKKWRHDIDQLIVAAINTPHRKGRCQPSAQQSRAIRGASTISDAKCTLVDAASRIDGKLHNDRPQGGNQLPPRWGRQPHRHRAPPRETLRYRGSQP